MSNIPSDLKYTKSHEWVRVKGDMATVGITDHAQHELTDIVFVELPDKGRKVKAGEACAVVGADAGHLGLLWLVILAIVMSAVSFYYYLQVLKQAYVLDAAENAPTIKVPPVTMFALVLLAVLVILLGCAPGLLLRHL